MDVDVCGLPLKTAQGLVNHDAGMGQGIAFALGTAGQQQRTHGCGLPHAERGHVATDVLHGVIDGESGADHAPGLVDVEGDVFVRVLGFQKEKLGHDEAGHIVVHRRT